MEEEQVDPVRGPVEVYLDLAADEGEAASELQQGVLDPVDESLLDVALELLCRHVKKVEYVGVLGRRLHERCVGSRQALGEVGRRHPETDVELDGDLVLQLADAPALLDGLGRVPVAGSLVGDLVEQSTDVGPVDLSPHCGDKFVKAGL